MLQKTHINIASIIANDLKLEKKPTSLLETGSTMPDSWGDFPHHHGKKIEILKRVANARNMFLAIDDECYADLGIALHYLADKWTLKPRTADAHTKWERLISQSQILDDASFLNEIEKSTLPQKVIDSYKELIDKLVKIKKTAKEIAVTDKTILIIIVENKIAEWVHVGNPNKNKLAKI